MNKGKLQSDDISDLGEFGLIRHLTSDLVSRNESTIKGVGDDAAVLGFGGRKVVISTDMLAEGVHFNLVYTPLKHLGYKAAVVNFSDVYAMNAQPRQLLVSMALSAKFRLSMVEEIYSGIRLACEQYGVDLVGGDTTSSMTGLVLSLTVVGDAADEELVYRSGAGINDLICVSGNLGGAYIGLQVLERERVMFEKHQDMQPALMGYDYVLERQLKPEARKDIIALLKELGIKPTSMIDISDGLSSELMHICEQSGRGCKIYSDKVPVHEETRRISQEFGIDPLIAALNGGEDYELLFTIPVSQFDQVGNRQEISIIGHVVEAAEGARMIDSHGSVVALQAQGWNALG
ncbi:MAG: thiamine-phosphate kinase [Bacteroidales bacterium]|nr:thiamine-phosphate kinase [Bacteroidales bacterium]